MATEPRLHHARADSGVGTKPASQTFEVQTFCDALATFNSNSGFEALTNLTKIIPQLEVELADRERIIKELQREATSLKNSHHDYKQSLFGDFEQRLKVWERKNDEMRESIENMTAAALQKEKDMVVLRKQCTDHEARVRDLEQEHAIATKRLKDKDRDLATLESKLQTSLQVSEQCKQELKKSNENADVLKKHLDEGMDKHQKLRDTNANLTVQLGQLESFSVQLQPIDLKDVSTQMNRLWGSAKALVDKFFSVDLPEEVLQKSWSRQLEHKIFKSQHAIPLPPANSPIAKNMRVAFILGSLARLIDSFIFEPTYLLEEECGLRYVLLSEARENPKKERFARGMLLSMYGSNQADFENDTIVDLTDHLLGLAAILLTPQTHDAFAKAVGELTTQFQSYWKLIQRAAQKLDSDFDSKPPAPAKLPWQILTAVLGDAKRNRNSQPQTTVNTDNAIIIVPRILLVKPDVAPVPITQGYILQKVDIDAAQEEVRRHIASSNMPFDNGASSRGRVRPRRRISVTADGVVQRTGNLPFL